MEEEELVYLKIFDRERGEEKFFFLKEKVATDVEPGELLCG